MSHLSSMIKVLLPCKTTRLATKKVTSRTRLKYSKSDSKESIWKTRRRKNCLINTLGMLELLKRLLRLFKMRQESLISMKS